MKTGRKPFAYLYIHWRATSMNNAVASHLPLPVMADTCARHPIKLADNELPIGRKTSRGGTVRTVPPREDLMIVYCGSTAFILPSFGGAGGGTTFSIMFAMPMMSVTFTSPSPFTSAASRLNFSEWIFRI